MDLKMLQIKKFIIFMNQFMLIEIILELIFLEGILSKIKLRFL